MVVEDSRRGYPRTCAAPGAVRAGRFLWALLSSFGWIGSARAEVPEPPSAASRAAIAPTLHATTAEADPVPPTAADPAQTQPRLVPAIERYRLDNGLRVVLSPDPRASTVAVTVTYDVGARNEAPGRSGFARLVERLTFQGTRNVPELGHYKAISARGGIAHSATTSELTRFHQTLPAGELALGLWLEAERMKGLALTVDEFERQRELALDEHQARIADRAYSAGAQRLLQLAFQGYAAYQHDEFGSAGDLQAARFRWAQAFHRKYYAPNNAVLSLAGAFEPAQARELIARHFTDVAHQPKVPPFRTPERERRQTSPRLGIVEDPNARTPGVYYGWVIPPARTRHHRALELAAAILADGDSARLQQNLIHEHGLARSVAAYTTGHRGPDLLVFRIVITERTSIDKMQEVFDGEVKRLRVMGPSHGELEKAKRRLEARFLRELASPERRALLLGAYETLWGDASAVTRELYEYRRLDEANIRYAAAKYLHDHLRTQVEIYPPGWTQDEPPKVVHFKHKVKKGDNLISIAKKYGSNVKEIQKANKLRGQSSSIYPGQIVLVPVGEGIVPIGKTRHTFKSSDEEPQLRYQVKKGDTLGAIALRHGTSVAAIVKANGMGKSRSIRSGQTLLVPGKSRPSADSAASPQAAGAQGGSTEKVSTTSYTVQAGDTLSGIALRHGTTVNQIAQINGMGKSRSIRSGQTLQVPRGGPRAPATAPTPVQYKHYKVKKGDNVFSIARRHGTTVAAIAAANGLGKRRSIRAGQVLKVPVGTKGKPDRGAKRKARAK